MDSLKIIVKGYADQLAPGKYKATSTTVLVKSNDKNVLIDPGLYPRDLKEALAAEGLTLDDIDIVLNSHSHQDHMRNGKLFDKSKVLNVYSQKNIPQIIPGTNIQVVATPGHVDKHVSFIVDTPDGKYAATGDVFWWEDKQEQQTDEKSLLSLVDPLARDVESLKNSRKKLLALAYFIIPGHGSVFRVQR